MVTNGQGEFYRTFVAVMQFVVPQAKFHEIILYT